MFGRKKKKDEEASIAGLPSVSASVGDASLSSPSVTPNVSPTVTPNVSIPPPSAPGVTPPADGSIPPITTTMTFEGGTTVFDARNVPGLRQELLDVISHGGNPAEIQDIVMKAMTQGHAITGMSPLTGGAINPPASPAADDPLDRLGKLNDLRVAGALTDAEFEAEKKKILGEM